MHCPLINLHCLLVEVRLVCHVCICSGVAVDALVSLGVYQNLLVPATISSQGAKFNNVVLNCLMLISNLAASWPGVAGSGRSGWSGVVAGWSNYSLVEDIVAGTRPWICPMMWARYTEIMAHWTSAQEVTSESSWWSRVYCWSCRCSFCPCYLSTDRIWSSSHVSMYMTSLYYQVQTRQTQTNNLDGSGRKKTQKSIW